jgi:acyl-coenzyme A synthetase/AMP-(fatty) acid ligase
VPDERVFEAEPAPPAQLAAGDPALIVFTSGSSGEPKPVRHGQRYLAGQRVQAEHWYGAGEGDLCWCTAASGWSLSARNSFVAAWLRGAAALLHDARFDPAERLELVERERVSVLCMSPTEYRAIAKRTELRPLPSVRHALPPASRSTRRSCASGRERRVAIHDGYGQTETGHLTGMPIGTPLRPGSMGARCRLQALDRGRRAVPDPATVPRSSSTAPPARGAPATACARTRTATSGSRGAPTT